MIDTNKILKNIIKHMIKSIEDDVVKVNTSNDKCMIKINELIWNEYIKIVMSTQFEENQLYMKLHIFVLMIYCI